MNLSLQNQQQQDWRKWIIITVILLLLAISHWSCHIQQRIEEAKIEAVKIDRLEFPCVTDSIKILIPGETSIIHDTTETLWHDSIHNWTYDTVRITKTVKKTDTIQVTVKDLYLINAWKDSVNVHKRIESHYLGQLEETKTQLSEEKKTSVKWKSWAIMTWFLFSCYLGIRFYFSLKFHL